MSLYEDKILHKAVEHFGADHQLNKLTEEVGELLVAVAHWRIGKDSANMWLRRLPKVSSC